MSRKTRKLTWSAPLLAVLAVAGALAIFATQTPNVAFAVPPDAPTVLMATAGDGETPAASGDTQIHLTWTEATGDPAVSGYKIEVSTDRALSWSVLEANTGSIEAEYDHTGLSAGQQRHYRVSAINADGTSSPSNIANAMTWSKPPAPMELTATPPDVDGHLSIGLVWVDVPTTADDSPITFYQVEASRSSSGPWAVLSNTVPVGDQAYRHSSLMAGQTWHYRVSAINGVGTGAPATTMATTWKAPAAPVGFTAMPDSMMGHTHINLSWSKVSAPETGGELTSAAPYKLFATTGGAEALRALGDDDAIDIPTDTDMDSVGFQHVVTGDVVVGSDTFTVAGGQTWHIQVVAANRAGIGPRSAVQVVKTWTEPGAPTGLTATAVSSTRVDLSWTAPTNTGGPGVKITGYHIEKSIDSAETWDDVVANTGTVNTTRTDTVAGTEDTVHYRVSAINLVGTGMASSFALAEPLNVPAMPTMLKAAAVSGTQIDLSWMAPTDPDAAPVTGYKIEFAPMLAGTDGADTVWSVLEADTESTDTAYMDMTLINGQMRYYRVSAINKAGTGAPSMHMMATAWDKPEVPTLLVATADGPSRIKLSWQPPGAGMTGGKDAEDNDIQITGYKIEVSDDLGETWSVVEASYNGDADATMEGVQYNHVGLTAGATRHYQVSAINVVGASDPSNIDDAMTTGTAVVPGMPTMVMAEPSADGTMLTVSWMAPKDHGGAAITGYKVMYRMTGSGAAYTSMDVAADVTSATISDLTPNTGYDIAVVAANTVGESAMATAMRMTGDIAPKAPGVNAMADGRTVINVSWMAPAGNGGSAVTEYTLQRAYTMTDDTMSTWVAVELANMGMGMMYMDTGLMPGTTYHYRVAATNAADMSEYAETKATTVANMAPTASDIPNLTVKEGMMSEPMDVSMYFTDPEGDSLTYDAMSSDEAKATVSRNGNMVTIMGVASGMATITVTATDTFGASTTQTFMVTVEATDTMLGNAGTPSGTPAAGNPDEVTFRWTPGDNATIHWVAVVRLNAAGDDIDTSFTPIWEAAGNDGMHTVTLGGAGTYVIAVIAGRTEDTTTWSMWKTARYTRQ